MWASDVHLQLRLHLALRLQAWVGPELGWAGGRGALGRSWCGSVKVGRDHGRTSSPSLLSLSLSRGDWGLGTGVLRFSSQATRFTGAQDAAC